MQTKLVFTNLGTETTANIISVDYVQRVNPSGQFEIGTTAMARLTFSSYDSYAVGTRLEYRVMFQESTSWTLIGIFEITEKTHAGDSYCYICYDNMHKFEKVVDSWYSGINWSTTSTAYALFNSLCTACGCTGSWLATTQNGYPVSNKIKATNLQGRTVLRLLTEIAGGFAYANESGVIVVKSYTASSPVKYLDEHRYFTCTKADYTVPAVDRLIVEKAYNGNNQYLTITKAGTTGQNPLLVKNNFFCYGVPDATLTTYFNNQFSKFYAYVPFSATCYKDFGINAGEIITVDGSQTIVMAKKITLSGVSFEATGGKERSEATALKSEMVSYVDMEAAHLSFITEQTNYGIKVSDTDNYSALTPYALLVADTSGTPDNGSALTATATTGLSWVNSNGTKKMTLGINRGSTNSYGLFGYTYDPVEIDWVLTKYQDADATEEWNTVGGYGGTTEPSYNNWPTALVSKSHCVKGFILELKASTADDATVYATTTIMAYPYGKKTSSNTDFIITAEATSGTYKAYCRINFTTYKYKVWVNDITRSAVLKCFY